MELSVCHRAVFQETLGSLSRDKRISLEVIIVVVVELLFLFLTKLPVSWWVAFSTCVFTPHVLDTRSSS